MAKIDLRKLKDSATELFANQKWGKAAELYAQISTLEPNEPDWFGRQGECWRKLGDGKQAVEAFSRAAEGYARNGFLLKAIAVCKTILQVDPRHTITQAMLAELYAKRDAGKAPIAAPPPPAPPPIAVVAAPAPKLVDPVLGAIEAVDLTERQAERHTETTRPAPRTEIELSPGAAIESVSLHRALGGRQSAQFQAISIDAVSGEIILPPAAYEIELGEDEFEEMLVGPEPIASPPAASPSPPRPTPLPVAPTSDEMDFSGLMDDEAPPVAAPPRPLPRIPLFSSLPPDRLQDLIEQVTLREVAPGTVLVQEGEAGVSLFVIVTGTARVELAAAHGPLAELGEGSFFGELGLLTDFPRSASVVAATELTVLEISRELVARLIADEPEILRVLLRFFRERMVDRWLKTSPLFATLSPDDARTLSQRWKLIEVGPGVQVITPGRRAEGMFLLLCGHARVLAGPNQVVARLDPGQVFGEMSLLSAQPATSAVETETKCWALCLERQNFQEIMVTYPQVLQYVSELAEARQSGTVRPPAP